MFFLIQESYDLWLKNKLTAYQATQSVPDKEKVCQYSFIILIFKFILNNIITDILIVETASDFIRMNDLFRHSPDVSH